MCIYSTIGIQQIYISHLATVEIQSRYRVEKGVRAHRGWSVVAERSSLPDSSSGVSSRMWVRIPAVTLVSMSKTLNHNCFSPPRG